MVRKIKAGYKINIKLPFWLNWTKWFMKIDIEELYVPAKIKNDGIDIIILDDNIDNRVLCAPDIP